MSLRLTRHASLKTLNTFGVEARAGWLAEVSSPPGLAELRQHPSLAGLPWLVIGCGSNLLLTRDFDGVVVRVDVPGIEVLGRHNGSLRVQVGAGEAWHRTVEHLLERGFPGLENLALIPGRVGAAPMQNIGAYGVELAERLHEVQAWDRETGAVLRLRVEDCAFGYRDSVFRGKLADRAVIVGVTLALPDPWEPVTGYAELASELAQLGRPRPTAREVFDAVVAIRRRKLPDPAQLGNAGSFFRNPIVSRERRNELIERHPSLVSYALAGGRYKLAAGWLIEACGLKGVTRGRAGVYERQALVLVNRGGATGGEILALAREIQEKVAARFGVMLEPEPLIV